MDFAEGYLTADTINQNLRHMEFPWPSPVVSRGNEIEREIKKGKKFPFEEVIHAHAGDPQGMGQKPVTFFQQVVLSLFNNSATTKPPGVMIPIPQYPLFSSTVAEYGMYQISYYLNEEKQWALDVEELQRAINLSKPYCEPKVLVIINPGN
ncbi:Alanine aminotransferase 2-like protein, partial [Stegodyphus mimosarum]